MPTHRGRPTSLSAPLSADTAQSLRRWVSSLGCCTALVHMTSQAARSLQSRSVLLLAFLTARYRPCFRYPSVAEGQQDHQGTPIPPEEGCRCQVCLSDIGDRPCTLSSGICLGLLMKQCKKDGAPALPRLALPMRDIKGRACAHSSEVDDSPRKHNPAVHCCLAVLPCSCGDWITVDRLSRPNA